MKNTYLIISLVAGLTAASLSQAQQSGSFGCSEAHEEMYAYTSQQMSTWAADKSISPDRLKNLFSYRNCFDSFMKEVVGVDQDEAEFTNRDGVKIHFYRDAQQDWKMKVTGADSKELIYPLRRAGKFNDLILLSANDHPDAHGNRDILEMYFGYAKGAFVVADRFLNNHPFLKDSPNKNLTGPVFLKQGGVDRFPTEAIPQRAAWLHATSEVLNGVVDAADAATDAR
jgi:hypothetical protein